MTLIIISIIIGTIWLLVGKKENSGCGCFSIIIIGLIVQITINSMIDTPKSPTDKLDLRLSNEIESFAEKELSSFIKNRDDIVNTILKLGEKRDKYLKDAKSIKSKTAKNKLHEEVEKLNTNISVIRKKAEDINESIEELYAIKEIENKDAFETEIRSILKKSEDLKVEASEIASDMENFSKNNINK